MNRFSALLAVIFTAFLFLYSTPALTAQMRVGVYGNYGLNTHTASFSELAGYTNWSPGFTSGSGAGIAAGALVEFALSDLLGLGVRAGYTTLNGEFSVAESVPINLTGAPINATIQHRLSGQLGLLSLEPMLMLKPFQRLFLHGGISAGFGLQTTFSQREILQAPDPRAVFADTRSTTRNEVNGERIPGASSLNLGVIVGASYDIMVDNTFSVSPEVFYRLGLTPIASGVQWSVHQLRAGVSVRMNLLPTGVEETQPARKETPLLASDGNSSSTSPSSETALANNASTGTLPVISLEQPLVQGVRNAMVQHRGAMTIQGKVQSPNGLEELTINFERVAVGNDGRFLKQIFLPFSQTEVLIRATDKIGKVAEVRFYADGTGSTGTNVDASSTASPVAAGTRYIALLVAVEQYADPAIKTLNEPQKDIKRLRAVLEQQYGFASKDIITLVNPRRSELLQELDNLSRSLKGAEHLVVFYAGHGFWDDQLQQGFWLPSDAQARSRSNWISNGTLVEYMRGIKSKHTLLISDACFSGSIFRAVNAFDAAPADISELNKLPSRKAMTSGSMKEVPDKSVFVDYLVKRLTDNTKPFLTADELFRSFRQAVITNSPNKQVPQYGEIYQSGDEGGEFVFVRTKK